ncbi:MAG: RpiB/LacA/LacB family sugar-phosphate isomerase [Chthoniobacteraceae bacterium]
MKIAIASDHAGFLFKKLFIEMLKAAGHDVRDFGTDSEAPVDYPRFIVPAAEAVARRECERGIVIGGSGNGEAMAANKVNGARCAVCWSVESAEQARRHMDANMLSLGQRMISPELALEITRVWLETPFEGGRHTPRVQEIAGIETTAAGASALFSTHEKTVLIRPEFLNHHGSLFGGYMMEWADDMAFNAASLTFPGNAFVTRRFDAFDFVSSVRSGDIIKVYARVESIATTSCQVAVWCLNARTQPQVFRTTGVMVNIDESGAKAAILK